MATPLKAKYTCLACPHTWEESPGPTDCKQCGSLYIDWTNYTDFTSAREYPLIFPRLTNNNTLK